MTVYVQQQEPVGGHLVMRIWLAVKAFLGERCLQQMIPLKGPLSANLLSER